MNTYTLISKVFLPYYVLPLLITLGILSLPKLFGGINYIGDTEMAVRLFFDIIVIGGPIILSVIFQYGYMKTSKKYDN
jgi:hypothetical protein